MPSRCTHYTRWLIATLLVIYQPSALAETVIEPLTEPEQWQLLSYSSIPPNDVSFDNTMMEIVVNNSTSPMIYPLEQPSIVKEISFSVTLDGQLNLTGKKQGEAGADDFQFRLGVVYEGEERLNIFEQALAPNWVQTLFELAPEGAGISYISFYNIYSDSRLAGQQRLHPQSELIREHFAAARPDQSNAVSLTFTPEQDKRILALWLSCDGDDTDSSYTVQLQKLTVITK